MSNLKYKISNNFSVSNSGQAILTSVVFFMFISMIVVSGAYTVSYKESKSSRDFGTSKKSFFMAESGLEDLAYRITKGKSHDTAEVLSLDGYFATTTVADINGAKEITATGTASKMIRRSKIKLTNTSGMAFHYGVQVGSGGVEMGESSDVVGSIYSNGSISGDNGAQISGDAIVAGQAGANSISGVIVKGDAKANSISGSKICGNAYYQSIDSGSLEFLNSPTTQTCGTPVTNGAAYPNSSDPPVENMPVSQADIDQWKADAQAGGTVLGNYNVTSNVSLGPKEITGNLTMNSQNKILTVTGNIYVRGNIDIDNGSTIRCNASYGAKSCLIVADGWIHADNNGTFAGSGTAGSFIMLLTTLACDGSFSEGCTHHNGAVDVHNNATGVIFYAQNGKVNLHNGVNVTEVTAYKLSLDNNAVITYDQGLANSNFSSGPSGGYSIESWRE